jgi:predicted ABC-type ATPase
LKRYIIIAGGNGVGKSTLYQTGSLIGEMEARINLDEIVRSFGDWRNPDDVGKAGKMAIKKIDAYFNEGISFNQETTLCGKSIIANILRAKKLGYCVELYYIGLDSPELAKERVKARVNAGGHGIPDEDIERRYYESLKQLIKVIPLCDTVMVFDNSKAIELLAEYRGGKCYMEVEDAPKWYMNLKKQL